MGTATSTVHALACLRRVLTPPPHWTEHPDSQPDHPDTTHAPSAAVAEIGPEATSPAPIAAPSFLGAEALTRPARHGFMLHFWERESLGQAFPPKWFGLVTLRKACCKPSPPQPASQSPHLDQAET